MKYVVVALVAFEYVSTASAVRPRGVGPEFAKFYGDTTTFACISDPQTKVPFSRVNDDYCDCPDGSDEPGSAACAHLSSLSPITNDRPNVTNALPGFYCKNKGHIPAYVPFARVNDGICDYELCCDGSEEWDGITKCKDRCDEIGKEWRKHDMARQKAAAAALKKRLELVNEAQRARQRLQDQIQTLGTEIEGAEIRVKNMEAEFRHIQKREAGKTVNAAAGTGKLGQLVELARNRVNELRDHLVNTRTQLTESRARLRQLEQILSSFKEEYNPNFNDEGVKRAVRGWEDYIASNALVEEPNAAVERDLDEITKADSESGLNWDEYGEGEEASDTGVLYSFANYLPPNLRTWVDDKLRELRQALVDGGILASSPSGAAQESKKVTDARDRLESAKKDLENSQKSLSDSKEDLDKDFGPDDVFRALKGTCVDKEAGEYIYEYCFLDKATQKSKKGGGHTGMGNYVRMEKVVVDEELPADGKGLGSGERIAMKHENGQHCWNGPDRATTVILACSETNEIWKILEEEKCVYRMEVGTPAVCERKNERAGTKGKDEL